MAKSYRQLAAGAALAGAGLLISWFSTRGSVDVSVEDLEEDPGLATLGEIEDKIFEVEGFFVRFTHADGRNARSNKRGFAPYPYQSKKHPTTTVSSYLKLRVDEHYGHHGLKTVVIFKDGAIAMGGNQLGTVRESYK